VLKIILCDDDPFILRLSADKIVDIVETNLFNAQIASIVMNDTELFSYIKNNPGQYLIFLDLDFGNGKLNGIDIAKVLRKIKCDCKIVFTTNHHEMGMDVLKSGVEAFGFLEKTSNITKLIDGYQKYIQMALNTMEPSIQEDRKSITLNISVDESISILINDIVFVETEKNVSHGITYRTINGSTLTIISTLDAEQKRLGDDFIRVHRSFLVNKRHLLGMKGGYLKLSNQQEVPCSFRLRGDVKKWIP